MSITFAIAFVLMGFLLLIWSADLLVDNASELGRHLGVSTFLIGIIVIGFGTSAPELFVSAMAALDNKGNLALGNALGSNITNIGLVLGCAALVRTLPITRNTARVDIPLVILAGVISVFLVYDGLLSNIDGYILLALLLSYLLWSARSSKMPNNALEPSESPANASEPQANTHHPKGKSTLMLAIYTIGSIIVLMVASRMLVKGAVTIAEFLGVGELVIGLTIVAIGTSLPELAAAIAAARKGVHDMIIGNIIGSNIFNTLGVLGLTGVIRATDIDTTALWRDFPVMFAFTALMLIFAIVNGAFTRLAGATIVLGYVGYLSYLIYFSLQV